MLKLTNEEIINGIGNLSVLELVELIGAFKARFNVTIAAPSVESAPIQEEVVAVQKTEFAIFLKVVGEKKMNVLKEVRVIAGLGLLETKTLVEKAPVVIKEGVSKDDAEKIKKTLEDLGATIEIQ